MFSVVNVYLDHLKFCAVCLMVECMSVVVNVMLSLTSVMSLPPIGAHVDKVMYFWSFCFMCEFRFLNCDDICMFFCA